MIKKLFTTMLILISVQARALVADKFKCQIQITEYETSESLKQELDFFTGRLSLSASPAPDVRITNGNADGRVVMENKNSRIVANLTFYYEHAVKVDNVGNIVDARQETCMLLYVTWCDKGNGSGGYTMCGEGKVGCFTSIGQDIFDPIKGWPVVNHFDNIPAFDEKSLIPYRTTFKDDHGIEKGEAIISCQYKGTYQ